MTRPSLLLDEVRTLALVPQESSVETILELQLGNCARDSALRISADSPTSVSVEDVRALGAIYSSSPEPLAVILLPNRDLFLFVAKNELVIEATAGEERLVLILGKNDDDVREVATLDEHEDARVTFAGLAINQTYMIVVMALISPDSLFDKAEEIFKSGGPKQEALTLLDRALALNPDLPHAWRRKAYIHRELGQAKPALLAAERSLQVDPNYALGWRCKGALLRDRNEHQLGLDCYLRSLELDPTDSVCWRNKGNALAALGRAEEAKAAYAEAERVEARYPDHSE